MSTVNELKIPDSDIVLKEGDKIKLGRFDRKNWEVNSWLVNYGWYSWGGNRPVCGWYLSNTHDLSIVKPLQLTDLDDIYLIEDEGGY